MSARPTVSAVLAVLATVGTVGMLSLGQAGCGRGSGSGSTGGSDHRVSAPGGAPTKTTASTAVLPLPGSGRPQVTIGDKNFSEQFVLGALYQQALEAQGFSVLLNENIGPTQVTIQALRTGTLGVYPEYLSTWNAAVFGDPRRFGSERAAYSTGQRYARAHGLVLLDPTPFSDTDAIAVTLAYAKANSLSTIGDLGAVDSALTLGGPLEFQHGAGGLPAIEQAYGVQPAAFKALEIGGQYQALDAGAVQAADVKSTDGQLASGDYALLGDPKGVFGWGNVVPVVSAKVLAQEGPAFPATINRVDALLSTAEMRRLASDVDLAHQDPAAVAKQFLQTHGLVPLGGK